MTTDQPQEHVGKPDLTVYGVGPSGVHIGDQPQEHGVGGVANCRECGEPLEAGDAWFHDPCTGMEQARTEIERLQKQVAELQSLKAGVVKVQVANRLFDSSRYVPEQRAIDLEARCAQLEAVADAAGKLTKLERELDAHRTDECPCWQCNVLNESIVGEAIALRRALAALDQHTTEQPQEKTT